jgi:hypothetical protein
MEGEPAGAAGHLLARMLLAHMQQQQAAKHLGAGPGSIVQLLSRWWNIAACIRVRVTQLRLDRKSFMAYSLLSSTVECTLLWGSIVTMDLYLVGVLANVLSQHAGMRRHGRPHLSTSI